MRRCPVGDPCMLEVNNVIGDFSRYVIWNMSKFHFERIGSKDCFQQW